MGTLYHPTDEPEQHYWETERVYIQAREAARHEAPYACIEPEMIELAAERAERDLRDVALTIAAMLLAFWLAVS